MTIDNTDPVINMAQQAADISNHIQNIYRRRDGSQIFCAKGNFPLLKQLLNAGEEVSFVRSIKPSTWPTEEKE